MGLFRKKPLDRTAVTEGEIHGGHVLGRHLTVRDLTFFGIAAIIGAGSFSSMGEACFKGGPGVVLLFVMCGIACGFTALCYAEFAARAEISERGKRTIAVNLKCEEGVGIVLDLCRSADVLIEGFRPGVAERLGIGPDACMARNRRLVYGRMTGWGQTGPLAGAPGHDINYISLSGALHAIGRAGERPVTPLNLVGDFGGGGLFLAFGVMCAVFESRRSGQGQVVDASMVEGSATLLHMIHAMMGYGRWRDERGVNLLDGAAHFYDTYETKDCKYVSVGSIEPEFYGLLVKLAGLDAGEFAPQYDAARWPALKQRDWRKGAKAYGATWW